jgi:small subunit ribosomal protein S18
LSEWKSGSREKTRENKDDAVLDAVINEPIILGHDNEAGPSSGPQKNVVFFFGRKKRRKVCRICTEGLKVDYKNTDLLSRFLNDQAKILSRRKTGTCAKHQHQIANGVKRAREVALLPYSGKFGE